MKKVLDFTGIYKPKDDERVVRGNIALAKGDDFRGFDKIVAFENDKDIFDGVENVFFIKPKASKGGDK